MKNSNSVFELGFTETPEELSLERLPVRGSIPEWLSGTLVRNGPGTFRVGDQQYRHWFDGLAMLHKFAFDQGRVSYANKFLDTKSYREAQETGRIAYSEFATDPCRDLFGRIQSVFSPKITDSAKVSIARMADRVLALAETPIQVEFDPETLETAGVFKYEDQTVGQMTTVHPHFDGDDAFNLVVRYNRVSHMHVHQVTPDAERNLVADVPVKKPSYMHSFGMSENYFILTAFPLVVNPLKLLLWLKPFIENFSWEPRRGTPFYVVDRRTGELVGRFEAEPFFAFHHVNSFEEDGELVVDLVAYPDADIIQTYYLNRLRRDDLEVPFGKLTRYWVPLREGGPVKKEVISDACIELPHFDYARYNTRGDYRYVYGIGINPEQRRGFYNQLLKIDVATGEHVTWYEPDTYPGEPIFVASPESQAEDDGVLLSVVLDAGRGNSFLLVLDAATLEEIGRAEIPQPILFGYHGVYLR